MSTEEISSSSSSATPLMSSQHTTYASSAPYVRLDTKSVNGGFSSAIHDDDDHHGHSHHEHEHGHDHGHSHGHHRRATKDYDAIPVRHSRSPSPAPKLCGGLQPMTDTALQRMEEDNASARRKLGLASFLCLLFMVAEIVGGLMANSLAVLTDAAHLLSDLAGFLISIFALWLASKAPTSRLSFGFHRAEILGALVSVLLIWLLTGVLVYEAAYRVMHPEEVDGKLMFIVASAGLGVNILMGLILWQSGHGHSHGLGGGSSHGHSHGGSSSSKPKAQEHKQHDGHGHDGEHGHSHGSSSSSSSAAVAATTAHDDHGPSAENINVTAAFVHVLGDAFQSVGVMIGAGLIWYNPEWRIADPICTFLFSVVVLVTTVRLIRQSVGVLMEGAPEGIDPGQVEEDLTAMEGVLEVHDLHIWSLSVGKPSLSVHLLTADEATAVLARAKKMLGEKYRIYHTTLQVEKKHDAIDCNPHYAAATGIEPHQCSH